ncbi:hypothetical protein [Scytonema sp. NUACC21]
MVAFLHEQIQWLQTQSSGVQVFKPLIIPHTPTLLHPNTRQVRNKVLTSLERQRH